MNPMFHTKASRHSYRRITLKIVATLWLLAIMITGSPQTALSLAPQAEANKQSADAHLAETLTYSFQQRFEAVIEELKTYLSENHAHRFFWQQRLAVILDLDETLLDNRAYYAEKKMFNPDDWHRWIIRAEAPGIAPSVVLVSWLHKKRYKVYFVSGRLESERAITVENLKKIGLTPERYDGLYLRPDDYDKATMSNFKISAQQDIERQGFKVVAFLGDQDSDMKSAIGRGFKLPNPIYTVP